MSDTKFTPAPWRVFTFEGKAGVSSKWADVAHCFGFDSKRTKEEELSNAHLIAAAPELYEALDIFVSLSMGDPESLKTARAALAKARGEQQ